MLSSTLNLFGAAFGLMVAGAVTYTIGTSTLFQAHAEQTDILAGCSDIPEVVLLAGRLQERSERIEVFLKEIELRKREVNTANIELLNTLEKISVARADSANQVVKQSEHVKEDVSRLIAVYDQMKPDQAAGVISNLPPDFAAEILTRLQPENSAKIISAVDPNHAAILTSYMGSRSVRR